MVQVTIEDSKGLCGLDLESMDKDIYRTRNRESRDGFN